MDEVYLSINGKFHYHWRAVDQGGEVLDTLVQQRRNKQAAKKFFTDNLRNYGAAKAEILPDVVHIQNKGKNNNAENSRQPTRERQRHIRGFKSEEHAQRFLASFCTI